jgi:hypothetical protein
MPYSKGTSPVLFVIAVLSFLVGGQVLAGLMSAMAIFAPTNNQQWVSLRMWRNNENMLVRSMTTIPI